MLNSSNQITAYSKYHETVETEFIYLKDKGKENKLSVNAEKTKMFY